MPLSVSCSRHFLRDIAASRGLLEYAFRITKVNESPAKTCRVSRAARKSLGRSLDPTPTVFGLPLLKPPYGRVVAIDLKTGERLWSVPNGNTPDNIKSNPKLKGVDIPNTGAPTRGTGLLVTSTLLFGGGDGPVLRAWDKKTGAVVAEIQIPGPTPGFPVTYTKTGRQYIAVAVRVGDAVDIAALALPAATAPSGRGGRGGRGGQ